MSDMMVDNARLSIMDGSLFIKVGAWRSLVAYLNGVQRVAGSNPVAPTIDFKGLADCWLTLFSLKRALVSILCPFPNLFKTATASCR